MRYFLEISPLMEGRRQAAESGSFHRPDTSLREEVLQGLKLVQASGRETGCSDSRAGLRIIDWFGHGRLDDPLC